MEIMRRTTVGVDEVHVPAAAAEDLALLVRLDTLKFERLPFGVDREVPNHPPR
jgi:hypothetical protein